MVKQDEMKQKSDGDVGVQNERELIQNEPVAIEESKVSEVEPVKEEEEMLHVGPPQLDDEVIGTVEEAKSGLRGAMDEPEGSESVNDDVVLFEHENHEEEDTTVIHMEDDGTSLENNESNDATAFEL